MSLSSADKIEAVFNPSFLGFQFASQSINLDKNLSKEVDTFYANAKLLKEKILKAVPAAQLIKNSKGQREQNIDQIGKKFSFESVENLKKNIHLFDSNLEQAKDELQQQAQQQGLALLMNSISGADPLTSFQNQTALKTSSAALASDKGSQQNNPVYLCKQILESRWKEEIEKQKKSE